MTYKTSLHTLSLKPLFKCVDKTVQRVCKKDPNFARSIVIIHADVNSYPQTHLADEDQRFPELFLLEAT